MRAALRERAHCAGQISLGVGPVNYPRFGGVCVTETLDPAARLHGLLDHCRRNNGSHALSQSWSSYLGLDPSSVAYVEAVAQMCVLPDQVRSAFDGLQSKGVSIPYKFFLEPLGELRAALIFGAQNQSGETGAFVQRYTEAQTERVLAASALLAGHSPQPADASDLLTTVASTADELSALLADDDTLEPDVRALLYSLADGLRRTAQTYNVTGAEGVAQERDLLVGRLATNPGLADNVRHHPEVMTVLVRFLEKTLRVASFFTTAVTVGEDVEKIVRAITVG